MAQTEVLLVQPIAGLGNEGEQVTVRAGYARNYLLPQKMALPVNRANRKQVDALVKRREQRLQHELDTAQKLADRLGALSLSFAMKTGQGGKLFGSVTNQDIQARLKEEQGIQIDRHRIQIEPIKSLGQHTADVKLHAEVTAPLKVEVVSENPIEEVEGVDEASVEAADPAAAGS